MAQRVLPKKPRTNYLEQEEQNRPKRPPPPPRHTDLRGESRTRKPFNLSKSSMYLTQTSASQQQVQDREHAYQADRVEVKEDSPEANTQELWTSFFSALRDRAVPRQEEEEVPEGPPPMDWDESGKATHTVSELYVQLCTHAEPVCLAPTLEEDDGNSDLPEDEPPLESLYQPYLEVSSTYSVLSVTKLRKHITAFLWDNHVDDLWDPEQTSSSSLDCFEEAPGYDDDPALPREIPPPSKVVPTRPDYRYATGSRILRTIPPPAFS